MATLHEEDEQIRKAKAAQTTFSPEVLENDDTLKQLLARSRYLLFNDKHKWQIAKNKGQHCCSNDTPDYNTPVTYPANREPSIVNVLVGNKLIKYLLNGANK